MEQPIHYVGLINDAKRYLTRNHFTPVPCDERIEGPSILLGKWILDRTHSLYVCERQIKLVREKKQLSLWYGHGTTIFTCLEFTLTNNIKMYLFEWKKYSLLSQSEYDKEFGIYQI